jgi:uroporphyrinogen III methyltransferase/synthase
MTGAPLPLLSGYSWLVFTSAAGVDGFFERLRAEDRDVREAGPAKIAAVGPFTGKALASRGLRVDLIPPVYGGAALGEALRSAASGRLLLLRAEKGSPELAEILRSQGLSFDEIPLYRAVPVKTGGGPWDDNAFDAVAFSSASSVRNLPPFHPGVRGRKAACIGERTEKAAREAGYETSVAKKATLEDLADALERLFER